MANSSTTMNHERAAEAVMGSSALEALAGIGAVALAIIALAGVYPTFLASIAAIVLGGALLFEGAAITTRYTQFVSECGSAAEQAMVTGGPSAEFVGGAAGVVLGILALLGIYPSTLVSVAALVFGAALLVGSGANARLNRMIAQPPGHDPEERRIRISNEAVSAASGGEFLFGAGAAVLGILAVVGQGSWLALSLVAFLSVGTAVLLTGTAVSGKIMSYFSH